MDVKIGDTVKTRKDKLLKPYYRGRAGIVKRLEHNAVVVDFNQGFNTIVFFSDVESVNGQKK